MKGTWQTTDSGGSGIGTAAAVVLVLIVVAAVAGPIAAAVAELVHAVVIAVAVILGLAALAGIAALAWRVRRGRHSAPLVAHQITPAARRAAESLPEAARPAIERPAEVHLHFHGVDAAEVAAIIADVNRARPPRVH